MPGHGMMVARPLHDANRATIKRPLPGESMMTQAGPDSIAGIGTDLLRVERIERAYARYGQRFLARILGLDEIQIFHTRYQRDPARGVRFLATRFAAKEAFSKAIGLGMHSPMAWSRMQTLNESGGKPKVVLSEPLAGWYRQRFGAAHVSITDESDIVLAFVVVERTRTNGKLPE